MMTADQRVKLQIGELVVQICVAAAEAEAKDARIRELEAQIAAIKSEKPDGE